jgi:hypothetical protein
MLTSLFGSLFLHFFHWIKFADSFRTCLPYGRLPDVMGSHAQDRRSLQLFQGGSGYPQEIQNHLACEFLGCGTSGQLSGNDYRGLTFSSRSTLTAGYDLYHFASHAGRMASR